MLAVILVNIASVCLFPHIVSLSVEFDQPVSSVVWTMVILDVLAGGVGGVAAALGVTLGNRRMLAFTLLALLVGCLIAALSTDLSVLIVGRAFQGIGLALHALAVGIVAAYWRGDRLRRALSLIVVAMGAGAALGYLLSGLVWRAGGDWRTLFWIVFAGTGLDLILTFTLIKETKRVRGVSIDYPGCVGFVAWAILILVPLSQANAWGWGSTKVLGLLLPGLAVLVLWVLWELHSPAPLIDLRILRRTGVWQGFVVWVAISMALYVTSTAIPYLLQTPEISGFGLGESIFVVSLVLAVPAVVMMVFSATTPALMHRYGARATLLLGTLFGLAGFGLAFAHASVWVVVVWLAAIGVVRRGCRSRLSGTRSDSRHPVQHCDGERRGSRGRAGRLRPQPASGDGRGGRASRSRGGGLPGRSDLHLGDAHRGGDRSRRRPQCAHHPAETRASRGSLIAHRRLPVLAA
jgi:MFS family permease